MKTESTPVWSSLMAGFHAAARAAYRRGPCRRTESRCRAKPRSKTRVRQRLGNDLAIGLGLGWASRLPAGARSLINRWRRPLPPRFADPSSGTGGRAVRIPKRTWSRLGTRRQKVGFPACGPAARTEGNVVRFLCAFRGYEKTAPARSLRARPRRRKGELSVWVGGYEKDRACP